MVLKRTKKRYAKLFDDPTTLFPGCEVILFPNGEPEMWLRASDGSGLAMRIRANHGPAGLMLDVSRTIMGLPLATFGGDETADAQIVQYHTDSWSQAFEAWVQGKGEHPGPKPQEEY